MKDIIFSVSVFLISQPLFSQFFVNTGGIVGIQKGAMVYVQNMDAENHGSISHAGDLTVVGNILNAQTIMCDPVIRNSINVSQNWTNNGAFSPGKSLVTFTTTNQSINGTSASNFNNLIFNGNVGDVKTMGNNVSCSDSFFLMNVELATSGNQFTLRNANIPVQRNSGYISTPNSGSVKLVYPAPLIGNTEVPLGFGIAAAQYKPIYLVNPAVDSFVVEVIGNSPAKNGKSPGSLQDSLCTINDKYYYRVQTYGSTLYFGVTQTVPEEEFTKLSYWNGSRWDKITNSDLSPLLSFQNLSSFGQAPNNNLYISMGKERPFVDAGPDTSIFMTESLQLIPLGYFPKNSTFSWDTPNDLDCWDCPYPTFTMGRPGKKTITVSNGKGCEASDFLKIHLLIPKIYMANAFTPNDDNINDGFGPKLGPGDKLVNMKIYNRWGVKVFDGNKNWDGKYMGTVAMDDVYVYQIVLFRSGDPYDFKEYVNGTVTLFR